MKQLLLKIPSQLKNRPSKKTTLVALAVLLLLGGGTGIYLYRANGNKEAKVDCAPLVSKAAELLKQNNYQEARAKLKTPARDCSTTAQDDNIKDISKTPEYKKLIDLNAGLAFEAYKAEDKEQAKAYANQALKIHEGMTSEQRVQIAEANQKDPKNNYTQQLADLYNIQQGIYSVKRPGQLR